MIKINHKKEYFDKVRVAKLQSLAIWTYIVFMCLLFKEIKGVVKFMPPFLP